ncbi:MAG TPA: hypothetical protein VGK59_09455 [Ohtaekwangia sp.]
MLDNVGNDNFRWRKLKDGGAAGAGAQRRAMVGFCVTVLMVVSSGQFNAQLLFIRAGVVVGAGIAREHENVKG